MRWAAALSVIFALLSTISCVSQPEWGGTIEERDGVVYVTNPQKGLWDGRDLLPIRFELEQVFGVDREPEEAIIGPPLGTTVDNDGNVYLIDWQANEIVSFAPDGSVRFRAGRPGQGPGELHQAVAMAWDGGASLFVANMSGTRIDRWTTDGEFNRTVVLSELGLPRAFGLEMVGADQLLLSVPDTTSIATEYVTVSLGESWQITQRFRIEADPEIDLPVPMIMPLPDRVQHGILSVGGVGSYVLRRYDLSGRLVTVVRRPREHLPSEGFTETRAVATHTGSYASVSAPLVLSSGHWVVTVRWPTDDEAVPEEGGERAYWSSSLDVFDSQGRFLGSHTAQRGGQPSVGWPFAIGPGNYLYTIAEEPFPQVRRYRVEIGS